MIKRIQNYDDGNLIWFDYNDIENLNDLVILGVQYGTEYNEDDIVRITRDFDSIELI